MKILSDEEISGYVYKVSTSPPPHTFTKTDGTLVGGNQLLFVRAKEMLKAQHKDTLRQVRELLDGIENPLLWSRAEDFNRAIQTIKALLEE